jgi:hypothetical protein
VYNLNYTLTSLGDTKLKRNFIWGYANKKKRFESTLLEDRTLQCGRNVLTFQENMLCLSSGQYFLYVFRVVTPLSLDVPEKHAASNLYYEYGDSKERKEIKVIKNGCSQSGHIDFLVRFCLVQVQNGQDELRMRKTKGP